MSAVNYSLLTIHHLQLGLEQRIMSEGKVRDDFELLEKAALRLLELGGLELLNYQQPAKLWALYLIRAGAPIGLVVRQFGKSIVHETCRYQRHRAEELTSLGFLLFEFWQLEGQPLPASLGQAWNSLPERGEYEMAS